VACANILGLQVLDLRVDRKTVTLRSHPGLLAA
jgi:hypothetical protein